MVIDYSRKYVQIKVTNIDKYNGNSIIINTQNCSYSNYNLSAPFEVEGTGKNSNNFKGSNFNENITGTTSVDKIYTGGGTDTITAGKGDDFLSGSAGDNTITVSVQNVLHSGNADDVSAMMLQFANINQ